MRSSLLFAILVGLAWHSNAQEIKIERKERTVPRSVSPDDIPVGWRKIGDNLFRAVFVVPPGFIRPDPPEGIDPFGDSPNKVDSFPTAQSLLEHAGIVFEGKARATYVAETSRLVVEQSREQLELIEYFVDSGPYQQKRKQVAVRIEIYQVSSEIAMEVMDSSQFEADHLPERNALKKGTKEGLSRLVEMAVTTSELRHKGSLSVGKETAYPEEIYSDKTESEDKGFLLNHRYVGTLLEFEPTIDPDGVTLMLDLSLEHHTAPPEITQITSRTDVPSFHTKHIATTVSLQNGDWRLIGSWKPTGPPEYENANLMHLVFVTATIQTVGDYGLKEQVEH